MTTMRNTFATPTERQLYLRDKCLENAQKYCSEYFEAKISMESVYDFDGTFTFLLNISAKQDTGLLFLTNKCYIVTIGRRGKVMSRKISPIKEEEKVPRSNKYLIF